RHAFGLHPVDGKRALPIAELAHIEIDRHSVDDRPAPTEQQIARGLHQTLAGDHALRGAGVLAGTDKTFEHGRLCFLELKEQWVVGVRALEETDPAARSDAPDPDDLARQLHEAKLLEQGATIVRQAAAVLV